MKEFQSLILWLEEQHIRRYPIDSDQRNGLRQFDTGDQWQIHYEKYLKDVECPFVDNNVQSVCWLLGYALRLDNIHGTETESGSSSGFLTQIDGKILVVQLYFQSIVGSGPVCGFGVRDFWRVRVGS